MLFHRFPYRISSLYVQVATTTTISYTGIIYTMVALCVLAMLPKLTTVPFLKCYSFHYRNIKDFMFQTGDPTGTGKGGNSIWGKKFEDEFHETLKVCVCE